LNYSRIQKEIDCGCSKLLIWAQKNITKPQLTDFGNVLPMLFAHILFLGKTCLLFPWKKKIKWNFK